jgi:hypothetical protein
LSPKSLLPQETQAFVTNARIHNPGVTPNTRLQMLLHLLQQFSDCEEDWYAGGAKSRFGRCQANAPGPE